jgi:trehalose utilization protein
MRERKEVNPMKGIAISLMIIGLGLTYAEAQIKVLCWTADERRRGDEHAYQHLPNHMADALAQMLNNDPEERFAADAAYEDTNVDLSQYQVLLAMDYESGKGLELLDQLSALWEEEKIGVFIINEGIRKTFWDFCGFSSPAGVSREGGTYTIAPVTECNHPTIAGVGSFTLTIRDWYLDLEENLSPEAEPVLEREDGYPVAIVYQDPEKQYKRGVFFTPGDPGDPVYIDPNPEMVKFFYNAVLWLTPVGAIEKMRQDKPAISKINYPNPFNSQCYFPLRAKFKIQNGKYKIYNILGQLVREIKISNLRSQSSKSIYWDGRDTRGLEVPAGVYFYEVAGEGVSRMVVLK